MDWNNLVSEAKENVAQWATEFRKNFYLILFSFVLLIIAAIVDYYIGNYVTTTARTKEVFDLILDHVGPYNLSFLFVYGFLSLVVILFAYPLIFKISKFHVVLSQFSLLIIVRALFMSLTHLKNPTSIVQGQFPHALGPIVFQNDLFFSGHVAIAFLGFLIFKDKKLKYFFLIATIVMAVTVLLMHQHYSIDVFSAPFITYGSWRIGNYFLKKIRN